MAITVADTDLNVTYARPGDVIRWLGADALDEAEQARATCISNKARHQHFIAGRTLLRHSLSAAVRNAVEPAAWRFARSTYGKSSVTPGLPPIHFSISHAEGLVAVATSPTAQVGMDLELETGNGDTSLVLDHLTRTRAGMAGPAMRCRQVASIPAIVDREGSHDQSGGHRMCGGFP